MRIQKAVTNQSMLYEQPKNILEMKLNETLRGPEESLISDLIKVSLLKKAAKDEDLLIYTELYNLLGLDKFTELISLIDGRTIDFPDKEDFKEIIITVLCYYYRNVQKKEWSEIKSLLGIPELNTIRYGIRASQLEAFIKEFINKRMR